MEQWIMQRAMRRAEEGAMPYALVLPTSAWMALRREVESVERRPATRGIGGGAVRIKEMTLACPFGNLVVSEDPEARTHHWVDRVIIDA